MCLILTVPNHVYVSFGGQGGCVGDGCVREAEGVQYIMSENELRI